MSLEKQAQAAPESFAIFGGSFNPPGVHHLKLLEILLKSFSKVILIPCGLRAEKFPSTADFIPDPIRRRLIEATFESLATSNFEIDFRDIESGHFTATIDLYHLYRQRGEPWFVVGADLFSATATHKSEIQRTWKQGNWIWKNLNFACVQRPGFAYDEASLPPKHRNVLAEISGSSSLVRAALRNRTSVIGMVVPEVATILKDTRAYLTASVRL